VDPPDGAALAGDPAALVVQVQLFDVEGQDLVGARRRLIQEPPQRLVP
jgi:hypothetical protein